MPEDQASPEQTETNKDNVLDDFGQQAVPDPSENPDYIFSSKGIPFKTEQAARNAIGLKKLDPNQFHVMSHEDGFVIVPKADKVVEKYYRVMFNHKTKPDDEDNVALTVNGDTVVLQRGVATIVSAKHRECADHTTYPHFTMLPNQARKEVGTIHVFPYQLIGDATEKEYLDLLKSGNKTAKEALEKDRKLLDQ